MRHKEQYLLLTWPAIYQAFGSRSINQGYNNGNIITNKVINADLELIESYADPKFLEKNEYSHVRSQIEQIRYYPGDGTRYSFIEHLHETALLLREGEALPGFKKGFKNNVFSNLGWYNQFLITISLSRQYKVLSIEHKFKNLKQGKSFDCDVELEMAGKVVHCQIKDIAEHIREERLEDIKSSIEHGMEWPDGQTRRKMAYKITDFKGSPPSTMPMEKWVEFGQTLDIRKREFTVRLKANQYGQHEAKLISFKTHGFRRGSFTYSPMSDFNNLELLMRTFDDVETRVQNSEATASDYFMLITNSNDRPYWSGQGLKQMRQNPLALMTVEVWGSSMISFTTMTAPRNMLDIEKDFNQRVKREWVEFF